jgi:hypothetical protein
VKPSGAFTVMLPKSTRRWPETILTSLLHEN